MDLPESKLTKSQFKTFKKNIEGEELDITVTVRYDDNCGNGHNSFGMTADIYQRSRSRSGGNMHGCCHGEIAKYFPELEKYIKWHLTSSNGPMHYVANATHHATRIEKYQHFVYLSDPVLKKASILLGLFSDEELEEVRARFEDFDLNIETKPHYSNKEPNVDAARSCAVWPDASLEDLLDEDKLKARLPELMKEFKADVEELGFTY